LTITLLAADRYVDYYALDVNFRMLGGVKDKYLSEKKLTDSLQKTSNLLRRPTKIKGDIFDSFWVSEAINYEINDDGIIDFTVNAFFLAIKGVDITRIRNCKHCLKVFWAGRRDKVCCSDKCKNSHNVHKSNIKKKETNRHLKIKKIREFYRGKEVWAYDEILTYTDSKSHLSKSDQLNDTLLKIIDILFKDPAETNILEIVVYKPSTKRKGIIELKYNNKLDYNLDRIFRIK
jgi:hypothetical protein